MAASLAGGYEASALVAGDHFFGFLDRGYIPPWLPEADGQNTIVIEAAAAAAGRLAVAYMVVYDAAVGPWFLPTFAAATGLKPSTRRLELARPHGWRRRWRHRVQQPVPTTAGSERWRGLAR